MDFKQLRAVLTDHFIRFLADRKAQIDETGPLTEADQILLENTLAIAEMELADGAVSEADADRTALELIKRYDLEVQVNTPLFETFKRSIAQGQRDTGSARRLSDVFRASELAGGPARPYGGNWTH